MNESTLRAALCKHGPCITYTVSLTRLQVIGPRVHVLHRQPVIRLPGLMKYVGFVCMLDVTLEHIHIKAGVLDALSLSAELTWGVSTLTYLHTVTIQCPVFCHSNYLCLQLFQLNIRHSLSGFL